MIEGFKVPVADDDEPHWNYHVQLAPRLHHAPVGTKRAQT